MTTTKKKLVIDTDPGIDDAMAIFVALRSPEVELLGLTTIFGNVYTTLATRNALHLLEAVGRTDIPVAEGSHVTIKQVVILFDFAVHGTKKATKLRIASFVHGSDGLGNQNFPPPTGKPLDQSAAAFLVKQANLYPGQVTVVALGPLTNLALAIELDPSFPKKIGQIVILGGAYSVNGNVNPAAEANIFGDPDAADIVFTSGADILAVGINITHQVVLSDADREKLEQSDSKYARYLSKILGLYYDYHKDAYFIKGVYLHDPATLIAAVDPSLMTYTEGVVRVQTDGITKGLTVFDTTKKRYGEITAWTGKPTVKVAVTVDAPAVVEMIMQRLTTDD
uniref:uridine nucleosidase n=1 Tax=Oryza glaberrima TaxID=4538 RepID=I1PCE5_ORYGL